MFIFSEASAASVRLLLMAKHRYLGSDKRYNAQWSLFHLFILPIVRIMQKGCKPKLIVKLYLELVFNMQLQNLWGHANFLLPFKTKLLTWHEDRLWPSWKGRCDSWLCCHRSSCQSHRWVCHSCTRTHWAGGHLQHEEVMIHCSFCYDEKCI